MNNELKALARAYGDGTISESELHRLEGILQNDPHARQQYLHELNLIDAMEELSLSDALPTRNINQLYSPQTSRNQSRITLKHRGMLGVLAAAVLMITSFIWMRTGNSHIGTIAELHGHVRWTGSDGVIVDQLQAGDLLPGGTLEILSANAWATFRFHDRSTFTLSGDAEAVFSDQGQKRLLLRHGNLSADVQPQRADSPMLVRTSSAEMQVLGTQFNVNARATQTLLAVNEGRVSLLRSSDGKRLEVPAQHLAIASLDAGEDFTVQPRRAHIKTWQSRLENDTDVMHGFWKPPLFDLGSKLKRSVAHGALAEAEALEEYKRAISLNNQGTVWAKPSTIGCFVWLNVSDKQGARVLITHQTQMRIVGRLCVPTDLEIGISTYASEGGFTGKHSRKISLEDLNRSPEGEFEVVVYVGDLLTKTDDATAPSLVHDWWCVAESNTAKFEVVRVEIFEE
jgi:ferric-dicitrate binding protein FerR (iron transport regulator)